MEDLKGEPREFFVSRVDGLADFEIVKRRKHHGEEAYPLSFEIDLPEPISLPG